MCRADVYSHHTRFHTLVLNTDMMLKIKDLLLVTYNVNGSHRNRGDPRCTCCCGFKVSMYLNVEYTKCFNDPKGQTKN